MAMTSLKKEFVSSEINKFFDLNGRVTVNATLLLLENTYTSSVNVKRDIQRKVIEVIQVNNKHTYLILFRIRNAGASKRKKGN